VAPSPSEPKDPGTPEALIAEGLRVRETTDQLRLLIESVQDYAILTLDTQGHVSSWNPGAQRIKGYRADEIIGSHFSRFYLPEEVANGKPAMELEVATRPCGSSMKMA